VERARADSGVIDLFAIHKQASEAPPAPDPLASAPPPAFTTDLLSVPKSGPDLGLDLDDENPFGKSSAKKKPVYLALAGAGALLVIGITIAAFSGGSEPPKAAAAQKPAVTAEPAPAPPPPVQTAEPTPAAPTPAAPSTGAVASSKSPPSRGGSARKAAAPKKASGPKLEKVQSTGVPSK
jgi:hypothetical protein